MDDVKEILSRAGVFQEVDQETMQALFGELETVRSPRGITVFNEGEPGNRLYIIINGKMKPARRSADGCENLLTIVGSSDISDELSIFDSGPRISLAVCVTEASAASMSVSQLQKWISLYPDVPAQLLRMLARRLRRANNSPVDLISTDIPGRVAKSLLQLANRPGVQEGFAPRMNYDPTRKEITQLVSASREAANKALAKLTHHGRIRLEGESVFTSDTEYSTRRARQFVAPMALISLLACQLVTYVSSWRYPAIHIPQPLFLVPRFPQEHMKRMRFAGFLLFPPLAWHAGLACRPGILGWHTGPTPPVELWPSLAHSSMLPVFSVTYRRFPGTY